MSGPSPAVRASLPLLTLVFVIGCWSAPAWPETADQPDSKDQALHHAQCRQAFLWLEHEQVRFGPAASWIRRSSYPFLERLAEFAHNCPSFAIGITGHTDNIGDPALNQALSEARATAVADFLEKLGVSRDRLIASGDGATKPVADNDTAYGRERNRRIELRLIPGDAS